MIWHNKIDLDILNSMSEGTMMEHLGIRIVEIGDDYLKATMPVDHRTKQPMGLLHGGASAALSESMGSFAAVLVLEDVTKESIVGIEINVNHLKSVKEGHVYSITKPIKIGRKIQVWETHIYNQKDNLVATSRLTTMKIILKS